MTEVQPQAQQLAIKEDHTLTANFVVGRKPHMVSAQLQLRGNSKLALFGPSGAGKTTIIEAIAGLARLESGWVQLDSDILSQASPRSRHVALWQRTIGLLRQPPGLFPHLSVLENITYSSRPSRNGLVTPLSLSKLLELLDLTELASEMPYRLSGGQLQRVAIARVLYSPFKLLLLDEPYTGLDASWRGALTKLVIDEVDRRHVPCIVVTHDLAQAQEVADEIAIIQDGRILQLAPADEIVKKPNSKEVAQLLGYRSFIAATSFGNKDNKNKDMVWAIHPQKVILGEHHKFGVVLQGIVKSVKPAGVEWEVEMEVTQPNSTQATITFMHNHSFDQFAQDLLVQNNLRPGCQLTVTAIDPPLIPNSRPPVSKRM
ncbi:MAG: ATP-binding cassette domain-containing protein [Actinobacteria bacterium]|jgi:molybdate transport system ATP-binding protein/molybdopterin molybdotransferase|nr:ATP-binding cassette domain-containing protein [Actinomycetota bacterium]MCL6095402.1 ATP-binding cassette domain-containing protein [Actinomycetota bacterium]